MDGWAVGWADGRILDMITGVVGGGDLDGPDVRMNETDGLVDFDMAGNSTIVFDIAEEVPPPPSRAGGISSGLFLSILWDKN